MIYETWSPLLLVLGAGRAACPGAYVRVGLGNASDVVDGVGE